MTGPLVAAVAVMALACSMRTAPRAAHAGTARRRARRLGPARHDGGAGLPALAPGWLVTAVARAALPVGADTVAATWGALVAGLVAVGLVRGGPPAAVAGLVVALAAPFVTWPALRDRSRRRYEASLPGVLESVAGSLRSGAAPVQALAEAAASAPGPVAADLRAVVRAVGRGMVLADALAAWSDRRDASGVELAVAAMEIGLRTGGAQGAALDGVAATLRQRQEVDAEARALGTQARVSALVIAAAPPAFGLVAGLADARTADFLLRTPVGLGVVLAGLGLDAAGAVWMATLTKSRP